MFDPKEVIAAALKGSYSGNPVGMDAILAKANNKAERAQLEDALRQMATACEVMHCTITQVDQKSKKSKTVETYWQTGMAARLPYSHGRVGHKPNTTSRVSL